MSTKGVNFISVNDLIRLTTKTISDKESPGIKIKLKTILDEVTSKPNDALPLRIWLEQLEGFDALSDTIAALKAKIDDNSKMQSFCTTLLKYVDDQESIVQSMSTMPTGPRPDDPAEAANTGKNFAREYDENEKLAWDLINQS